MYTRPACTDQSTQTTIKTMCTCITLLLDNSDSQDVSGMMPGAPKQSTMTSSNVHAKVTQHAAQSRQPTPKPSTGRTVYCMLQHPSPAPPPPEADLEPVPVRVTFFIWSSSILTTSVKAGLFSGSLCQHRSTMLISACRQPIMNMKIFSIPTAAVAAAREQHEFASCVCNILGNCFQL